MVELPKVEDSAISSQANLHGYVAIDAEILARFHASLPRVIESRSLAWHLAWALKLLAKLAFFGYSLQGLYNLEWSPAVLLAFLVVGVWTAWLCDLLAIALRSHQWLREENADSEHAFVLEVSRRLKKKQARISSAVLGSGGTTLGGSLILGGMATAIIGVSWLISQVSLREALLAQPTALAILIAVFASQIASTLITARSKGSKGMASLSSGGSLSRLLALWFLMFFCFVAAVNDLEDMRHLIGALYAAGIVLTLVGLLAMPALWRETGRLRAYRPDA